MLPMYCIIYTYKINKISDISEQDASQKRVSGKNKNKSCIVDIRNLARPFTNTQLIGLLKQTGSFDKSTHFWVDKAKSHAMVKYDRPQEAEATVQALDAVKWPSSNLKQLIVTLTSEDHFERQSKEPVSLGQSSPVSESSKKATSSSSSRSRQKRQRITSDSSSGEDFPKTSSKISKPISESCSSNAETDPEEEGGNISQLSDVLIQHGKKNVGADNKPTSYSNEVQKIKMPLDKLVVNVEYLDETGITFYDFRNKVIYPMN